MESVFRTPLAERTFENKYKHDGCETWDRLAKTLTDDVFIGGAKKVFGDDFGPDHHLYRRIKELKDIATKAISEMKFIPGGRYLYYAGRPAKYYNNCFSGDTVVITSEGEFKLEEILDKEIECLSPVTGDWTKATCRYFGRQTLYEITFSYLRGSSSKTWTVKATRNHRWPLVDGTITENLNIGDVVKATSPVIEDEFAFVHGFMYGDGNANGQLRLCNKADHHLIPIFEKYGKLTYPGFANGDPCFYLGKNFPWKELPDIDEVGPDYIASFIKGWYEADGSKTGGNTIASVNKKALEWLAEYAYLAGFIAGTVRKQTRDVTIRGYTYKSHEIYILSLSPAEKFQGFKVIDIKEIGEDDVYCLVVPEGNQFTLKYGIATGNCYVLFAEEDTREDWANLAWKATSCLMTGGGIGIDYSVYRPSNTLLGRTGGFASGPIPIMHMINEIGRNVMQGGSRRSAIYASLNWRHGDIDEFIKVKDWYNQPVPGTDKTVGDLKEADFDYRAPLDMTNISVNFDTSWVEQYSETGEPGEVFEKVAAYALRTGEPGFSFNFFDKERETGRNACCEVTSEDDSDVCNLGSINLSRIESLEELSEITYAATVFLLFGTFVADLPYEKVYKVREKNRRLGLGLMGIHEWLLMRGHKYEVVPELHLWLSCWKGVSDEAAKEWSTLLSCSEPVAKRAVAPTGTIGMVAGTTTGIEPIFAVAYKRRYLVNNRWHYQYTIDHTAQTLIDLYGLNPDNIETSFDLAKDPERRIKFQADIQRYVDQGISSTINLPKWGSKWNNEDKVKDFAKILAKYATQLRGFTCYPDGARGGQPLVPVAYEEAINKIGKEYIEDNTVYTDVCDLTKGGVCGS